MHIIYSERTVISRVHTKTQSFRMSRKAGITVTFRELRMSKLSRNTRPPPCGKELNVITILLFISIYEVFFLSKIKKIHFMRCIFYYCQVYILLSVHYYYCHIGLYGCDGVFRTEELAHFLSESSLCVHGELGT